MSRIPSKTEILRWISENPGKNSKREISRAFGIKGADRIDLKRMLKQLEQGGELEKRRKTYRDPNHLPPVAVLRVLGPDSDGDLFARPTEWQGENRAPRILVVVRGSDPALGEGDRILARLSAVADRDHEYEARLIRRIASAPQRMLGIFRVASAGGRVVPVERGADKEWRVAGNATNGAQDGELVRAEQTGPKGRLGQPSAQVTERLGDPFAARSTSLIAIHRHAIPDEFAQDALAEAEHATPPPPHTREDLTQLPLVTIDPADARDHDDAVFAHPDDDANNKGGHVVWVAIADVAHFVRPATALDREARKRGNSTYFADRVVPMLPDRLSGDLCSLHEGAVRACLAVRMVLDVDGEMTGHRFVRGFMKSAASLSYTDVQAAFDGSPNEKTAPLLEDVINPLYAAYATARQARQLRQPLELDLPERRIELTEDGTVTSVAFRERLDAHRLIEEFMVLANVAAARQLIAKRCPVLFRVHEEPTREKLDVLRNVAQASGLTLAKGQVLKTRHLNALLSQARGTELAELINLTTLRSMTQAYYNAENFGHFGLALTAYAHFTSPIRRYADLITHRALITALGLGDDGLSDEEIG
ncbi:MAG: ribonuclease R family protein, partial [Paracoccaceae bacterium]